MSEHDYRVEPIQGERDDHTVARVVEMLCTSEGLPLPPPQRVPAVVGWRLRLRTDEHDVDVREFAPGEEGFEQAREAGSQWLIEHGVESVIVWTSKAHAGLQRMGWDREYRKWIDSKGFVTRAAHQ